MPTNHLLRGSLTALVTPFSGGKPDEAAFRSHVSWQIANGTAGLVPCWNDRREPDTQP